MWNVKRVTSAAGATKEVFIHLKRTRSLQVDASGCKAVEEKHTISDVKQVYGAGMTNRGELIQMEESSDGVEKEHVTQKQRWAPDLDKGVLGKTRDTRSLRSAASR